MVKAVVLTDGEQQLAELEVICFCQGKIADYKKSRSVGFVSEVPRNPSGKILKRILGESFWERRERKV